MMKKQLAALMLGILVAACGETARPPEPAVKDAAAVPRSKPLPSTSDRALREALVGTWFGEAPLAGGGHRMWIMRRSPDAKFRIVFKDVGEDGVIKDSEETGEWGVAGSLLLGIARTRTTLRGVETTSPSNIYFWDAYEIRNIDAEYVDYVSIPSGTVYRAKRVRSGFDFPVTDSPARPGS